MNFAQVGSNAAPTSNIFLRFWPVVAVVIAVFIGLVVYYNTIGYSIDFGWKRLFGMIQNKTSVETEIGIEEKKDIIQTTLKPEPEDEEVYTPPKNPSRPRDLGEPPRPDLPMLQNRPIGMPGSMMSEPSLFNSLNPKNLFPQGEEVYNVSRNIYTYYDAPAVCQALGGELASYDQVKMAYEGGADWCNYGWVKGQMAVYPTQKATYQKLQKGSPNHRMSCGKPGINGGYFDNPELLFGVNCVGKKPVQKSVDELRESDVSFPQSAEEIEFDKKVQKFREQLDTMNVLPFNKTSWSS